MCGRFYVEIEESELREIIDDIESQYGDVQIKMGEVAPTNTAPVLTYVDGHVKAMPMYWGLPRWKGSGVIFNSRAETTLEKNMFRKSLLERPILIPTSGFFEWTAIEGKKKKDMYKFNDPNSSITYLAGFYNTYDSAKDGLLKDRFTILTREPNASVLPYHDRMPIVIPKEDKLGWLSGERLQYYLDRVPDELRVELYRATS